MRLCSDRIVAPLSVKEVFNSSPAKTAAFGFWWGGGVGGIMTKKKRFSSAYSTIKEWVTGREWHSSRKRGRRYGGTKHDAILITPRCRFWAECSPVTHAWHQSQPNTTARGAQCNAKMRTHLSASVPHCLQTGVHKHTPTHPHKDIQRASCAHIDCTFFN